MPQQQQLKVQDLNPEKVRDVFASQTLQSWKALNNWNGETYPQFPTSESAKESIVKKFATPLGLDPKDLTIKVEQSGGDLHVIGSNKDGSVAFQFAADLVNGPPLSGREINNDHFYLAKPSKEGQKDANPNVPPTVMVEQPKESKAPKMPESSLESKATIELNQNERDQLEAFMVKNHAELLSWDSVDSFHPAPTKERQKEILSGLKSAIGLSVEDPREIRISQARGAVIVSVIRDEDDQRHSTSFRLGFGSDKMEGPTNSVSEVKKQRSPEQMLLSGIAGISSYYQDQLERWNTRTTEEEKATIVSRFQKVLDDFSLATTKVMPRITDIQVVAEQKGLKITLISGGVEFASLSQNWVTGTNKYPQIDNFKFNLKE